MPCQVGTHWIVFAEYSQMSTNVPGFQAFLHNLVLAKLTSTSIRVNIPQTRPDPTSLRLEACRTLSIITAPLQQAKIAKRFLRLLLSRGFHFAFRDCLLISEADLPLFCFSLGSPIPLNAVASPLGIQSGGGEPQAIWAVWAAWTSSFLLNLLELPHKH